MDPGKYDPYNQPPPKNQVMPAQYAEPYQGQPVQAQPVPGQAMPGQPMQYQPVQGQPQQQGFMGQINSAMNGMMGGGGYQPAQPLQPMGQGYQAGAAGGGGMTGIMEAPMPQTMDGSVPPSDIGFLSGKQRFFLKQRFEAIEALANLVGISKSSSSWFISCSINNVFFV